MFKRLGRPSPLALPYEGDGPETGSVVCLGGASIATELFARHVAVSGMPGTGKTTLVASLLAQLVSQGIGVVVIEPVKREYAGLLGTSGVSPRVFGANGSQRLATNPLRVDEGVASGVWSQNLADAICDAYGVVGEPLPQHFRAFFKWFFGKAGFRTHEPISTAVAARAPWPDPVQLKPKVVEYVATRCLSSGEVRANVHGALNFRIDQLVDCPAFNPDSRGLLARDLLGRRGATVLETGGLGPEDGRLFAMLVLMRILAVAAELPAAPLHTVVVLEEAHALFKSMRSGEATMFSRLFERALRTTRAAGIGFVTVDQDPDSLPPGVWANSSTKVCFACGSGDGREAVANALSLTDDRKLKFAALPRWRALLSTPGDGVRLIGT